MTLNEMKHAAMCSHCGAGFTMFVYSRVEGSVVGARPVWWLRARPGVIAPLPAGL